MHYCECGAVLAFSADGVHCVACYEARASRSDGSGTVRLWGLFQEYCTGLQAVIAAGADVRVTVNGCSSGVIEVEACGLGILVHYITAASPVEQRTLLAPEAAFTASFVDS